MDIEAVSYLADVAWEITRRKQAEMAVAEERRRLSDILRGTNVGTWEWNVQTGETVFNERWAEIIGYTLDELSPVNIETWIKFGHPDDLKKSGELLEKHFKGELDYYECEARMRHKDGRWVWVLDRGRVHAWTDDGKPLWLSGTHQDITERKHIEEVLSASEEKLRLTFESIADGIVIIDLAGNVVDVNEATVRISGYRDKSQIIGRDAFDLLAPRDRRLALEDLKERVEGHPKERVEYSICPKDGRAFEAELTASTLRDENGIPIGYIAVLRDITERKLAEEALRQSEQRFRELADLLPQTIVEIDTGGHFTYVNRYAFETTGYSEEDVKKGINALDLFVPEQRDMVAESIGRILAGEIIDVGEYSILRKDGSIYTALIYTNAVMRDGKPAGVRAIVVDISERKKIEQMKTDFVSFISHQLRTPVAGLMGYIDNMLDGITGELNSKQADYLSEMRDVCARNNRLIADLLNISRLERGVLSVNIQAVKLRNVVDIAAQEYVKDIEGKGLALNIKETDQGISALADSDKLAEVLKNVIHNALKFTQKGSINIDISMEGDNGIIKISDTGDGMPEEVLKDLFKREKVLSGAVAVGGGAGLGLYIAKGFMQLQRGDIEVESVVGGGSTFTMILPRE
jgi:PAS domain S-box-containing protein